MPRKVQGRRDRGTYRHRGKDRDGQDIWQIRVRLGYDPATKKYKQVAKAFHGPEREVKRELTKMLRELDTGSFVDPSGEAFGDFVERWLAQVKAEIRLTTWDGYACMARKHIILTIGRQPLQYFISMWLKSTEKKVWQAIPSSPSRSRPFTQALHVLGKDGSEQKAEPSIGERRSEALTAAFRVMRRIC